MLEDGLGLPISDVFVLQLVVGVFLLVKRRSEAVAAVEADDDDDEVEVEVVVFVI
jgi:hypothetical protein